MPEEHADVKRIELNITSMLAVCGPMSFSEAAKIVPL
jgi:hypothetical protein